MVHSIVMDWRQIKFEWKKTNIKGLIQFTVKIIYATTIAEITWEMIAGPRYPASLLLAHTSWLCSGLWGGSRVNPRHVRSEPSCAGTVVLVRIRLASTTCSRR